MKLTRREIILLSLLLTVALVFGLYQFVYTPVMKNFTKLTSELQQITAQADTIRTELMTKPLFAKRFETAKASIQSLSTPFFSSLKPERFILLTRDMLVSSGLTPSEYSISPVNAEVIVVPRSNYVQLEYSLSDLARQYRELSGTPVSPSPTPNAEDSVTPESTAIEVLRIGVSASGSYAQIQSFLAQVESLNRRIVVDQLSLVVSATDDLTVNLSMYYIGLDKMFPQTDDPFDTWTRPDITLAPTPGIFR